MSRPSIDNWVRAHAAQPAGWLGQSVTVICGQCSAPTTAKGRDTITVTNMGRRVGVFCSCCRTWNLTNLVWD